MFSIRGLRLYFPALEPWVVWSASLPGHSSRLICTQMWGCRVCSHHLVGSASCRLACPIPQSAASGPPAPALRESSLPWLPVSAPPTHLGECFFFGSLVVRLLYSLIFSQFWLFFVFKLLLSFFWLCEEAQCVYLRLHLKCHLFLKFTRITPFGSKLCLL